MINTNQTNNNSTNHANNINQILFTNSSSGVFLRLIYSVVIPWSLIALSIYLSITHKFNWLFNIQAIYYVTIAIAILAIILTFPWSIGTGLYGHVILPYFGYIVTGHFATYTYHHNSPSHLIINRQVYCKTDHTWTNLDNYLLQNLDANNIQFTQN